MVNIRGVDHARDEPHTHEQDRGQHVPVPAVVGLLDFGEDKDGITTNKDSWDDNRNGSCCHPFVCVSDATVFGGKEVCQENCKHGDCGEPPKMCTNDGDACHTEHKIDDEARSC